MGLKVFKSIKEEYNYYIDTFRGQLNSEEKEEFDKILANRDKIYKRRKRKTKIGKISN